MPETLSLTLGLNRFFGRKEGQTLQEFAIELKALTQQDRFDLKNMLEKHYAGEVIITLE